MALAKKIFSFKGSMMVPSSLIILILSLFFLLSHQNALGNSATTSEVKFTNGVSIELSHFKTVPQRAKISAKNGYVILEVLSDTLIHVEYSAHAPGPSVSNPIYTSPLVVPYNVSFPAASAVSFFNFGVETAKLTVKLDPESLCLSMFKRADSSLQSTICPHNLDQGTKTLTINSPQTKNIYGLGQYMSDPMQLNSDWKGKIWEPGPYGNFMRGYRGGATANTQIPVLYALGEKKEGYALFFDHIYRQRWDFVKQPWELETWGDQIRFFIITADDLPDLRRTYLKLTGNPPMPSKQLLGMWASEFGYESWQEVYLSVDSLKKAGFPLDGLALDLQWYGTKFNDPDRSTMGSLRWDQSHFPDPELHVKNLTDNYGLKLMLIEQPYISSALSEYSMLNAQGMLAKDCATCGSTYITYSTWWGRGGMLDFTNPRTNSFWHQEKRQKLINQGIFGHWTDLGEPEMYHANAYYFGFPDLGLHQHGDVHNIYNFKWVEGIYQGYRDNNISERPIILTRSGNAGIQRFNTAMWSGDIGANLDSLKMQIQSQMNVSLSGIDYYGSDVGGFYRASGDGKKDELYSMWFANAALFEIPVRVHVWNLDNQTSSLPTKNGHVASNLQNIKQRYELIPYYYSLAYEAYKNGTAIIAPLVYHWQDDPNVRLIADQKAIGPNLIGALITEYGIRSRDIYLPKGDWYNFSDNTLLHSHGEKIKNVPLYKGDLLTLPLFARSGSIIVKMPVEDYMINAFGFNLLRRPNISQVPLVIRVYPDENASEFSYYEDDGHSFAYEKGSYRTTRIKQQVHGDLASLIIEKSEGTFENAPNEREVVLEIVQTRYKAAAMTLHGSPVMSCRSFVRNRRQKPAPQNCFTEGKNGLLLVYLGVLSSDQEQNFSISLQ